MAMNIGAGWWGYMPRNLSLSITTYIDRDITRYEHGGGRRCISINGDLGRSVVGASGLKLEPSDQRRPQSEKDLEIVEGDSNIEGSSRQTLTLKGLYVTAKALR